jgi:hypothetical protein
LSRKKYQKGEYDMTKKNAEHKEQPEGPFCQSCGMPMGLLECFGTNADEAINEDYCVHCFQNGEFVDSKMTMEEMIDLSASIMAEKTKTPEAKAKEICWSFIPKLKRWNTK